MASIIMAFGALPGLKPAILTLAALALNASSKYFSISLAAHSIANFTLLPCNFVYLISILNNSSEFPLLNQQLSVFYITERNEERLAPLARAAMRSEEFKPPVLAGGGICALA